MFLEMDVGANQCAYKASICHSKYLYPAKYFIKVELEQSTVSVLCWLVKTS